MGKLSVYISADMEGVAGLVAPIEVWEEGTDFSHAKQLLTGEVNAAIQAAFDCDAKRVLVNDSHMQMRNISPEMLDDRAELIRGSQKLGFMMEGIDEEEGFDLAFFIGYHAMAGTQNGILCHTFSTQWASLQINGRIIGESTYNALYAGHFGCKVGLVSGDASLAWELKQYLPWAEHITVKEGIGNFAAKSISPNLVRQKIYKGSKRAIENYQLNQLEPFVLSSPLTVELTFLYPDRTERALYVPGVERINNLTVRFIAEDVITLNKYIRTLFVITS